MPHISEDLKALRLHYLSEHFEDFVSGCDKDKRTTKSVIERLVELELVEKGRRSIETRLKEAKLGRFKRMHEFDWSWPKKAERSKVEALLKGDFVTAKRNLILAGAQGLGKTMIAKNIGHEAVMRGKSVLFTTASDLVMTLQTKDTQVDLNRCLRRYAKPDLLIIDELGYLSYDCKAADLIFEVVNRRYEQGSILMTTNLAFKDWNQIFPAAACLTAMIDRITHHVDVVVLEGSSYRRMESRQS